MSESGIHPTEKRHYSQNLGCASNKVVSNEAELTVAVNSAP